MFNLEDTKTSECRNNCICDCESDFPAWSDYYYIYMYALLLRPQPSHRLKTIIWKSETSKSKGILLHMYTLTSLASNKVKTQGKQTKPTWSNLDRNGKGLVRPQGIVTIFFIPRVVSRGIKKGVKLSVKAKGLKKYRNKPLSRPVPGCGQASGVYSM